VDSARTGRIEHIADGDSSLVRSAQPRDPANMRWIFRTGSSKRWDAGRPRNETSRSNARAPALRPLCGSRAAEERVLGVSSLAHGSTRRFTLDKGTNTGNHRRTSAMRLVHISGTARVVNVHGDCPDSRQIPPTIKTTPNSPKV